MTFTVYKYELIPNDKGICYVKLPMGYKVLSAGVQDTSIFIWVRVYPNERWKLDVPFAVVPTGSLAGQTFPNQEFIDTVFMGPYVLHIFRIISKSI